MLYLKGSCQTDVFLVPASLIVASWPVGCKGQKTQGSCIPDSRSRVGGVSACGSLPPSSSAGPAAADVFQAVQHCCNLHLQAISLLRKLPSGVGGSVGLFLFLTPRGLIRAGEGRRGAGADDQVGRGKQSIRLAQIEAPSQTPDSGLFQKASCGSEQLAFLPVLLLGFPPGLMLVGSSPALLPLPLHFLLRKPSKLEPIFPKANL